MAISERTLPTTFLRRSRIILSPKDLRCLNDEKTITRSRRRTIDAGRHNDQNTQSTSSALSRCSVKMENSGAYGEHARYSRNYGVNSPDVLDKLSGPSSLKQTCLPGGASRLAALLLPQILPVFSVVAPCHPGAALRNPVRLQRRRATSYRGLERLGVMREGAQQSDAASDTRRYAPPSRRFDERVTKVLTAIRESTDLRMSVDDAARWRPRPLANDEVQSLLPFRRKRVDIVQSVHFDDRALPSGTAPPRWCGYSISAVAARSV